LRKHRFSDLGTAPGGHVLTGLVPGRHLVKGGLSFHTSGQRSHAAEPRHVHDDGEEVFLILQGKGHVELDTGNEPCRAGDVLVVERGENHHLTSSREEPLVVVWLHAGERP
jgi:mannose-6-phosphate isomerase-like protein (cupin superfamily)